MWPRSRARSKEASAASKSRSGELDPAELVVEAADVGGALHRLEAGGERGLGVDLVRVAAGPDALGVEMVGGLEVAGVELEGELDLRGLAPAAATVKLSPASAGGAGRGLVGEGREGAGGQAGLARGVDAAAVVEVDEEAAVRGRRGDADRGVGGQVEGGDEGRSRRRSPGRARAVSAIGASAAGSAAGSSAAACGIGWLIQRAPVAASGASARTRPAAGRPNDTDCTRVELSHGTCRPSVRA